jgi:hypothetical protein
MNAPIISQGLTIGQWEATITFPTLLTQFNVLMGEFLRTVSSDRAAKVVSRSIQIYIATSLPLLGPLIT